MNLKSVFRLLASTLFIAEFVTATPRLYSNYDAAFSTTYDLNPAIYGNQKRQNAKVALRIMSLGASIVAGADKSSGNGQGISAISF